MPPLHLFQSLCHCSCCRCLYAAVFRNDSSVQELSLVEWRHVLHWKRRVAYVPIKPTVKIEEHVNQSPIQPKFKIEEHVNQSQKPREMRLDAAILALTLQSFWRASTTSSCTAKQTQHTAVLWSVVSSETPQTQTQTQIQTLTPNIDKRFYQLTFQNNHVPMCKAGGFDRRRGIQDFAMEMQGLLSAGYSDVFL